LNDANSKRAWDILQKVTTAVVYALCATVIALMVRVAVIEGNQFNITDWNRERTALLNEIERRWPPRWISTRFDQISATQHEIKAGIKSMEAKIDAHILNHK